jgi:hypothetical protein
MNVNMNMDKEAVMGMNTDRENRQDGQSYRHRDGHLPKLPCVDGQPQGCPSTDSFQRLCFANWSEVTFEIDFPSFSYL